MNVTENSSFAGNLNVGGTLGPPRPRTELATETGAKYPIPLTAFRKWDAIDVNCPATPATTYLGISGGTWATNTPKLTTGDVKAVGCTRRARAVVSLPVEYVAAGAVTIRVSALMETTVSDTSATIAVEAYKSNRDGTVTGAQLVSTGATTMNSLTVADKDFTLTTTTLNPGDELDIRVTITIVDAATGTAVIGSLGAVGVLCSIRG